jgi:hypothetical protein
MDVQHMKDAAIADAPEAMERLCSLLLRDRSAWEGLRNNSRQLAARRYTWQQVFDNLEQALQGG